MVESWRNLEGDSLDAELLRAFLLFLWRPRSGDRARLVSCRRSRLRDRERFLPFFFFSFFDRFWPSSLSLRSLLIPQIWHKPERR